MFEKEAKKWVKENTRIEHSASFGEIEVEPSAKKGFQKGAEFGYNKGKAETALLSQHILDLQKDKYSLTYTKARKNKKKRNRTKTGCISRENRTN